MLDSQQASEPKITAIQPSNNKNPVTTGSKADRLKDKKVADGAHSSHRAAENSTFDKLDTHKDQ